MDIDKIKKGLQTEYMGSKIIYKDTTSSTNDDGKQAGEKGMEEGSIFISEAQTKGRGRMLREWVTAEGEGIALSILLRPEIIPAEAPTITPVLALSVVKTIKKLYDIDAKIKWPNDIFLDGKKLGGILTEMNAGMEGVKYIVIGLGLNIHQTSMPIELEKIATSLQIYNENIYDREQLISEILNNFEKDYEDFKRYGLKHFIEALKIFSNVIGKEVIVISGLELVEGHVLTIDDSGNLILRLEDGEIKRIIYGDISLKYKELLKD